MKAESPLDGKTYYFVDKCMSFGASISCAHFQKVSDAIAYLVKWRTHQYLINYLDDYLFVAYLKSLCNQQLWVFLDICDQIKYPVSLEKTFWAENLMVFLGLLIDADKQIVLIPVEKIEKVNSLINTILAKKKCTVQQLQKICGFLNFLGKCVVPVRAFTRRLYMHLQGCNALKSHHHIHITTDMQLDLQMWQEFIEHPSIYSRGFMDFDKT